jgi:hypothetical protein
MRRTVGVAPGTITINLSGYGMAPWWNLHAPRHGGLPPLLPPGLRDATQPPQPGPPAALPTPGTPIIAPPPLTPDVNAPAPVRWDLIGLIGGGALLLAITAGLLASR